VWGLQFCDKVAERIAARVGSIPSDMAVSDIVRMTLSGTVFDLPGDGSFFMCFCA
jgi:hypothetical protein